MLGLFSRFGRSRDLRLLDEALRSVGVSPVLIPDAVEFTLVRLLKTADGITPETCARTAALVGYCILGPDGFSDTNGPGAVASAEDRIARAIEAEDSLDARLVLLVLHAGLASAAVVERFHLESDRDG